MEICDIKNGPSKYDLMMSLSVARPKRQQKVTFILQSHPPIKVIITMIRRAGERHFDFECWDFEGKAYDNKGFWGWVSGNYSPKGRYGTVKFPS